MNDIKKKNVLVLEDSPTQAVELEYILEKGGYSSNAVINGKEGLEYLNDSNNKKPDIIISDIIMPEMNGFDFCKALKEDNDLKNIPVILLTALTNPGDVILGLECGADNFITKPYDNEYLLSRINYILINFQMREHQASDLGVNIQFGGKKYYITSDRVQILDLLFSSFENAVEKNKELRVTIQQLKETRQALVVANKKTEEAKKMLKKLATQDVLTGLYNRRAFEGICKKMLPLAKRRKRKLGMLHLDVDNFKSINDTLGHDAGDEVLKTTASKLTGILREEDIIGRIGGDEFAVLITDLKNYDEINIISQKIINSFKEPITVNGNETYATLSLGISLSAEDSENTYDKLLKEADLAMYEAKKSGKSQYRIVNDQIKADYTKRQNMEDELGKALRKNEFQMVYQPIIDLRSRKIVGLESLIRWENSKLGAVNPSVFIPFAEKTKQIHEIGYWIIDNVLEQCSSWKKQNIKNYFVSINISAIQFERKEFIRTLVDLINKYQLNPSEILIEITETAFSQFLKAETLLKMKKEDLLLAIDDFGSGYSSMQRLLELPIDFMKIDGINIKKLPKSKKYRAIIENIISIAKSLKIKTIAECVETEEQVEFLLENDCEYAQGFLYHKPLKPEEAIKLLE